MTVTRKNNSLTIIKFLAVFAGTMGAYYVLYASKLLVGILTIYINLTTAIAGFILSFFETQLRVTGNVLVSGAHELMVGFGCDGSEPIALFTAGVLAYPAKWKHKFLGALIGIIAIYILNLIRIIVLYYAGKSGAGLLELLHHDILPIAIVFCSILLWLAWLRWTSLQLKKSI